MKYQLTAPSWFDRLVCALLHRHERTSEHGYRYRRCLTLGCAMLVVIETPLGRLHRKAREQADEVLKRGGRAL